MSDAGELQPVRQRVLNHRTGGVFLTIFGVAGVVLAPLVLLDSAPFIALANLIIGALFASVGLAMLMADWIIRTGATNDV